MTLLYKEKLEKLLREIPELSLREKEYIEACFSKFLAGGINKWEAEKIIRELKLNLKDEIDLSEIEKIKSKILSVFV
jgi:hypothetical protein